MATLVIGGTGFVGARVVARLAVGGEPAVAFDWLPDPAAVARLPAGTRVVRGDVTEVRDLVATLAAHRDVRRIIHLAYIMGTEAEADPHLAMRVNALGVVNVFEAARLLGVPRIVFPSSQAVYGPQAHYGDRPVREADYCSPDALLRNYALTKLLNEHIARKYQEQHGMVITALRGTVIHGHGRQRGSSVWSSHFASLPAVGEPVRLPFPAAARACLLYVDDFAEQLVRLVLADRPRHAVYNSGGHTVSGAELAAAVRQVVPGARLEFDEASAPPAFVYRVDGSRLATEFGLSPRPLADSVRAHVEEARAAEPRALEARGVSAR